MPSECKNKKENGGGNEKAKIESYNKDERKWNRHSKKIMSNASLIYPQYNHDDSAEALNIQSEGLEKAHKQK